MIRIVFLLLFFWSIFPQARAATATVASASNFKSALDELVLVFQKNHPHQLKTVFAATGVLFNQIKHGAPFDVFLAADTLRPVQLEKGGVGIANTRFTYAEGRLALAFSQKVQEITGSLSDSKSTILDVLERDRGKIAIANVQTAPYGIAAEQSLQYLFEGQYQRRMKIQQRLVRGVNVNQCFQYVATGNTKIGFVALAQLIEAEIKLHYWIIPKHWHEPIRQQAILLQSGQHNQAAIAFMGFIQTPAAKKIIQRYGYGITNP